MFIKIIYLIKMIFKNSLNVFICRPNNRYRETLQNSIEYSKHSIGNLQPLQVHHDQENTSNLPNKKKKWLHKPLNNLNFTQGNDGVHKTY